MEALAAVGVFVGLLTLWVVLPGKFIRRRSLKKPPTLTDNSS